LTKKDLLSLCLITPLVFITASIIISGWPGGLAPNIHYPFILNDDGMFSLIQKIIEGDLLINDRLAFPFGASTKDYIQPDGLNFIIVKFISTLGFGWVAVHNIYYLASFSSVFVASFLVMRHFKIDTILSVIGSLAFTFIPFHFLRIQHLFYCNYFVVPIFWLIAYKIYSKDYSKQNKSTLLIKLLIFVITISLGAFGIYYALFGLIAILSATLFNFLKSKSFKPIKDLIFFSSSIIFGLTLHLAIPNLSNEISAENNSFAKNETQFPQRLKLESEMYAFTTPQLLAPAKYHRLSFFSKISNSISAQSLNSNENVTSSLGLIGSIGFVLGLLILLLNLTGFKVNQNLLFISFLTFTFYMFGLTGGFGSIFAHIISPSIRAWNRISVFVSFGTLLIVFTLIGNYKNLLISHCNVIIYRILLFTIPIIIFFDQIPRTCHECNLNIQNYYLTKKSFFSSIEQLKNKDSAIYQLPYMPYPENPPIHNLKDYELFDGFLFTKKLKWSYGNIKGTAGDRIIESLSKKNISEQIEFIKKIGFDGIYLNQNGYADNQILNDLIDKIGKPQIKNEEYGLY